MSLSLEPMGFTVLIKTEKREETTDAGIILPQDVAEREEQGQIIGTISALGVEAFPKGNAPEIGDTVMYARYAGQPWVDDLGNKFRIVNDDDIKGIIRGEADE